MSAIGVIDWQVTGLMQVLLNGIKIPFDHALGVFSELLVDQVGDGKALSGGLSWGSGESNGHAVHLGELLGVYLHLGHGPHRQLPGIPGLMHLLSGMKLHHLINPHHADGVDQAFQAHGYRSLLTGDGIAGLLSGERHAVVLDDLVHPLPLDLEYLHRYIHQLPQVLKEKLVVAPGQICRSRAVEGDHLPGAHGEVLTVLEEQLIFELAVAVRSGRELIGTALVAGYPLPRSPIGRKLVVEVGCAVLCGQLEGQKIQVLIGGQIGMGCIIGLIFLHEIRLDADLGLGEVEGLAPVIPGQHDLHQGLEGQAYLALEAAVGLERRIGGRAIPDPAGVDRRLVPPELGNARSELDAGEDQLASPGHHHLSHLVDEHLHQLQNLLVALALEVGGDEGEEVVEALASRKVGLGAA